MSAQPTLPDVLPDQDWLAQVRADAGRWWATFDPSPDLAPPPEWGATVGGWLVCHRATGRLVGGLWRSPARKENGDMSKPFEERLLEKFLVGDDCWMWLRSKDTKGYGHVSRNGKLVPAHRVIWEMLHGPIEPGLEIHHICGNKGCVRPSHQRPVTRKEHIELTPTSLGYRAKHALRCPAGHLYDDANTYYGRGGKRYCRACATARRSTPEYRARAAIRNAAYAKARRARSTEDRRLTP